MVLLEFLWQSIRHEKLTVTLPRRPKRRDYFGKEHKGDTCGVKLHCSQAFATALLRSLTEQVTTGGLPSATIMPAPKWHECAAQNLELKIKTKSLIWKTMTCTGGYTFSSSLSIWSCANCLKQFAASWKKLDPERQRHCHWSLMTLSLRTLEHGMVGIIVPQKLKILLENASFVFL